MTDPEQPASAVADPTPSNHCRRVIATRPSSQTRPGCAGQPFGEGAHLVPYLVRPDDGEGDWEIPLVDAYVANVDVTARVVEVRTLEHLERVAARKPKKRTPAAE